MHTENGDYEVIYRPLYNNTLLENVKFYSRPLDMFIDDVTKDGKTFPRFIKITDPEVIEKLEKIKREMYKTTSF